MKNFKFLICSVLGLIFSIGIYSCWQESVFTPSFSYEDLKDSTSGENEITVDFNEAATDVIIAQIPFSNISSNNGILAFSDRESMNLTLNLLKEAKETWNSEVSNKLSEISEEADINDVEVDDFYPFTKFETQLNFQSLRKTIEAEIDAWLLNSGDELDFDIYPGSHPVKDYQIRSIYNTNSEMIIGNSIFKEYNGGIGIEIPSLNFSLLEQLQLLSDKNEIINFANSNNLKLLGFWDTDSQKQATQCNWWEERNCRWEKSIVVKDKERRGRLRGEVGVYNSWPTRRHKLWAENDTFYKKGWFWRRLKTRNYVLLDGHFYIQDENTNTDGNCNERRSDALPRENGCICSRTEAETPHFTRTIYVSNHEDKNLKGEHEALNFSSRKKTCIPELTCLEHNCK